jgi:hypothetical protein
MMRTIKRMDSIHRQWCFIEFRTRVYFYLFDMKSICMYSILSYIPHLIAL